MSSTSSRLPIAIPGARGAYGQKAAQQFFGRTHTELFCDTSVDAARAVIDGRASHAILPVENTITGAYDGAAEAFFQGDALSVVGEVLLPIRHAVMARPGARLDDLSVIASHPSNLSQCRDWIAGWGFAQRPVSDTAREAESLASGGEEGLAVLGARELAKVYGLELLAEGLSDHFDNRTRFLVLGLEGRSEDGLRNALQVGPVSTPRVLKTLRIQLESLGASRVRVPFLGTPDGKRFLVEFDHRGGEGPRAVETACSGVPHRYLGAWTPNDRRAG